MYVCIYKYIYIYTHNEAFKVAKKEDQDAIVLLNQALEALTKFYKKNDVKMGDIQASHSILTGFTPKGRLPSETLVCPFTRPIKWNPILKRRASCVVLAEKLRFGC